MSTTFSNEYFSFEFFPPQTPEGQEKLHTCAQALSELNPAFFSVTFGAGGSTQHRTLETTLNVHQQTQIAVAPHISCVGATQANIIDLLNRYISQGVTRLVVLRGDLPSGMGTLGEFKYANELVSFIREQTGNHFFIEVAAYPECHPQSINAKDELHYFHQKVNAGANGALTQYFYNSDAYFYFIDQCVNAKIDIPIVPGIMPITNYIQLERFSNLCGAQIPLWMKKHLIGYQKDNQAVFEFGLDVVADLCERLLRHGAPGLHFYTLNNAKATLAIWERLGLTIKS